MKIFTIKSLTDPTKVYRLAYERGAWACNCPSAKFKSPRCKHVQIAQQVGIRRLQEAARVQ